MPKQPTKSYSKPISFSKSVNRDRMLSSQPNEHEATNKIASSLEGPKPEVKPSKPIQKEEKPKGKTPASRKKTMVRIVRAIIKKGKAREYEVEYHMGSEPTLLKARVSEENILKRDPQLLIEYLSVRRVATLIKN